MTDHNNLRALINSMTGSEKRYFKLNGVKNSKEAAGRFMELFDAIDKGYALKRKKNENLGVTARYLMNSLLDSLHTFNVNNSLDAQLDRQIKHGAVLYRKGLHTHALKTFAKAEKVGKTQQDFVRLQQIYWHLRTLLAIGTPAGNTGLNMESVLKRNLAASREIELLARLRFVQHRFQKTVSETNDVSEKVLTELRELLNSEAMNDVNEQSGFFSQLTAANIWSQFYLLSKDAVNGFKHGKKVFDLCYTHREMLKDRGRLLIGSANNYLSRCHSAKQFEEMKRVLDLLEKERPKQANVEVMRIESYYSSLLIYHIATKQFADQDLLSEIKEKLNEVGKKMNQAFLMLILSHCSHYAFFQNNLSAALKWINLYLNHENRNALAKNLSVAFDYRLIIYYEQNKLDLLENLLRATQAEKTTKNAYPHLRKLIRQFLQNELLQGEKHAANLITLRDELRQLKATEVEKSGFRFFAFDEWVETKIGVKKHP